MFVFSVSNTKYHILCTSLMKWILQSVQDDKAKCPYPVSRMILHTSYNEGHFTHVPRAVTMKLQEPKRKCPKVVLTHLQSHVVVWSQTFSYSVKSYVTKLSTKCLFNECFYSCRSSHMMKYNKSMLVSVRSVMVSWFCVRPTSKRWLLRIVQVTLKHYLLDAM